MVRPDAPVPPHGLLVHRNRQQEHASSDPVTLLGFLGGRGLNLPSSLAWRTRRSRLVLVQEKRVIDIEGLAGINLLSSLGIRLDPEST